MGRFQSGKNNPMYGRFGAANPNYGNIKEKVTMPRLHEWVRRYKQKPNVCEECKVRKPFDLANISGEYKRDINDFRWLCRSCHMKSDGRMKNINNKGRFKDLSKRSCEMCSSKQTKPNKFGRPVWRRLYGLIVCTDCYGSWQSLV